MDKLTAFEVGVLLGILLATISGVLFTWGYYNPPMVFNGTVKSTILNTDNSSFFVRIDDKTVKCNLYVASDNQKADLNSLKVGMNVTIVQDAQGHCVVVTR